MDRDIILERLSRDLIGPFEEFEKLQDAKPSDVYLTGILWPKQSRMGGEEDDRLAAAGVSEDAEGPTPEEEQVPPSNQMRPSVAGVSFAVNVPPPHDPRFLITITFGTYVKMDVLKDPANPSLGKTSFWQRRAHHIRIGPVDCPQESLNILLAKPDETVTPVAVLTEVETPDGVRTYIRSVPWQDNRLVTVTLVNDSLPDPAEGRAGREQATLFQTAIRVEPAEGTLFVARPSRRAVVDEEDKSLALLYRNAREFAVGHTCSAGWDEPDHGSTPSWLSSAWIPSVIVETVSSVGHSVFESLLSGDRPVLSLEWLIAADCEQLCKGLNELVDSYEQWLDIKSQIIDSLPSDMQDAARKNLSRCRDAKDRMLAGASLVGSDERVWQYLRLAFIAMRLQYTWSSGKSDQSPFTWRPFQLGFILLTIPSVAHRDNPERGIMDLLWFPTGGGKTEAYLGLVAFAAFHRRLLGRDDESGVSAVMRYTLRLLTTQQFARAAAVVLACETIRRGRVADVPEGLDFGQTPFSIGLWVGGDATPNRYEDARQSLQGSMDVSSPRQLAACPACGVDLCWEANNRHKAVFVRCPNDACILHDGQSHLPVWTVDDDIFREQPTLLIGTIDKFAQIVRKKEINQLFAVNSGSPPDLVIQDELHLISGPLGTVAGLYEVAIDRMFTRDGHKPKIIGSTATIRRASDQVRALFNRDLRQFPPPGLDSDDSGFAVVETVTPQSPGRRYAAVTTAGRSAKFTLQAVTASLLQSAGSLSDSTSRDHYGTLVSYFNSLRELGGALVLMQDDVTDSIRMLAERRNESPRGLDHLQELTSRRTQAEIREMLDMLEISADQPGTVDVVLATNMLSVGVDIPRLGLMVVNGQPKGISEYIQATSRVGRGRVPGLVVAVLNNAKARDRSHFETFRTWHTTLYRDVEATSVTPFASRARDRALHAVLVALCQHIVPGMLGSPRIDAANDSTVRQIIEEISARAREVDASETDVEKDLLRLLDIWKARDPVQYWNDFTPQKSLLQSAERAAAKRTMGWNEGAAWPTLNNMRNVEPATPFKLVPGLRDPDKGAQEDNHGK